MYVELLDCFTSQYFAIRRAFPAALPISLEREKLRILHHLYNDEQDAKDIK